VQVTDYVQKFPMMIAGKKRNKEQTAKKNWKKVMLIVCT